MRDFKDYLVEDEESLFYQYADICGELASIYQEVNMMEADQLMTEARAYTAAIQSGDHSHSSADRTAKYEALTISTAILQLRGKINQLGATKEFLERVLEKRYAVGERFKSEGSKRQYPGATEVGLPSAAGGSYQSLQSA